MLRVTAKVTKNNVKKFIRSSTKDIENGVRDMAQDVARTSSESAPHWEGNLEKSFKITYRIGKRKIYGTVKYSAIEDGFDYAIAMHEWNYELGEKSRGKSGGTGMSGTTYKVGRKFLTRVLEGEKNAYRKYLDEIVHQNL